MGPPHETQSQSIPKASALTPVLTDRDSRAALVSGTNLCPGRTNLLYHVSVPAFCGSVLSRTEPDDFETICDLALCQPWEDSKELQDCALGHSAGLVKHNTEYILIIHVSRSVPVVGASGHVLVPIGTSCHGSS